MIEYCSAPAYQNQTEVYFAQSCSTCGRPLRIRIGLLGKQITCPHCGAALLANGPGANCRAVGRPTNLEYAGQLLEQLTMGTRP